MSNILAGSRKGIGEIVKQKSTFKYLMMLFLYHNSVRDKVFTILENQTRLSSLDNIYLDDLNIKS